MSKLPSTATTTIRRYGTSTTQPVNQTLKPFQLLSFQYIPFPASPINSTTLYPTASFFHDTSHPLHIRTKRRLAAFDASDRLHWRVQCPLDVSKKAFIRNWATRRVQNAFARELKANEERREWGGIKPDDGRQVTGSLLIKLVNNKSTLTCSKEEVRASAAWLLERIMRLRQEAVQQAQGAQVEMGKSTKRARDEVVSSAQTHSPSLSENGRKAQQTQSHPDPEVIRSQVEYYFSDANLPGDRFLLSLTGGAENKPVSLKTLHKFKRMRKFQPYTAVKEAVRESRVLVMDEMDGVSRKVPLSAAPLKAEGGLDRVGYQTMIANETEREDVERHPHVLEDPETDQPTLHPVRSTL